MDNDYVRFWRITEFIRCEGNICFGCNTNTNTDLNNKLPDLMKYGLEEDGRKVRGSFFCKTCKNWTVFIGNDFQLIFFSSGRT